MREMGDLVDEPFGRRRVMDSRDSIPFFDDRCIHARRGTTPGHRSAHGHWSQDEAEAHI